MHSALAEMHAHSAASRHHTCYLVLCQRPSLHYCVCLFLHVLQAAQAIPLDSLDTQTYEDLQVRLAVQSLALCIHVYCAKLLQDTGLPAYCHLGQAIDVCAAKGLGNVSELKKTWHAIRLAGNTARHEFDAQKLATKVQKCLPVN